MCLCYYGGDHEVVYERSDLVASLYQVECDIAAAFGEVSRMVVAFLIRYV